MMTTSSFFSIRRLISTGPVVKAILSAKNCFALAALLLIALVMLLVCFLFWRESFPVCSLKNQRRQRLRQRRQIRDGRAVEDFSKLIKTRTVTRTIPSLLGLIPGHYAAQVRANCGTFVQHPGCIAINRDFFQATTDNCTGAKGD